MELLHEYPYAWFAITGEPERPEPHRVVATRWQCEYCGKTWASRTNARAHISRCFRNESVRACLTCVNFNRRPAFQAEDRGLALMVEDSCEAGVELPRRRRELDAGQGSQQIVSGCLLWQSRRRHGDDA